MAREGIGPSVNAPAPTVRTLDLVRDLMDGFLQESGVVGTRAPRRYLWTDAFAVCNLLELERRGVRPGSDLQNQTSRGYRKLAVDLVHQVHEVLGRHREDDPRKGWISGLSNEEAREHPTAGGLRIGKPLPERPGNEPFDPVLEWERDGQYYHYLTRWMYALLCVGRAEREDRYLRWAVELARAAHRGFLRGAEGQRHIVWKMSIDLSRPLVSSSGQHDPLDGYITCRALAAAGAFDLEGEIGDLALLAGIGDRDAADRWSTDDPLGLGGLLVDACRVATFLDRNDGSGPRATDALALELLEAAGRGLDRFLAGGLLHREAAHRLPFRELGLSIGLHAAEVAKDMVDRGRLGGDLPSIAARLDRISKASDVSEAIEATWCEPGNRTVRSWTEHADINTVMLCTSLAPHGYLRC